MLLHYARVNQGAMAMKWYSAFPIAGTSSSDCLVSYLEHSLGRSYPLCRVAIGIFYSPRIYPWLSPKFYFEALYKQHFFLFNRLKPNKKLNIFYIHFKFSGYKFQNVIKTNTREEIFFHRISRPKSRFGYYLRLLIIHD